MHFVIEESSWSIDTAMANYIELIEQLLDRLDIARERAEVVCASRWLFDQTVFEGLLVDFLWGGKLPRHVQERVDTHFGRMMYWDDDDEVEYVALDACIGSELPVHSPSAVFVQQRVGAGEVIACLPLRGCFEGPIEVIVASRAETVHFVVDEATHRGFFRDAVDQKKLDVQGVAGLATHAYPDTYFVENIWRDADRFEGGYARVRSVLLRFLATYDDHAHWIFSDETGRLSAKDSTQQEGQGVTRDLIERRFRAHGFVVAPESSDVAKDRKCRTARERVVRDQTIYCEWHWKIEPHTNRVHVHAPIPESNDQAIMAIFAQHLPLPGD